MEALKIAFDAIVVGALALPWLAMCLYLLMGEAKALNTWQVIKDYQHQIPPALGAVLIFVVCYVVGAAVSRDSGDFFNDDDLGIPWITEDGIRESVYSGNIDVQLTDAAVREHFANFGLLKDPNQHKSDIKVLFQLEEGALMLQGTEKLEQLSQLRAQDSVLRGAALDGFIFLVFYVFGWCANHFVRRPWIAIIPATSFVWGAVIFVKHVRLHPLGDPPFMEITLLCLGMAGLYIVGREEVRQGKAPRRSYRMHLLLSGLLTMIAYFGWWWSEVLYDRQVLHIFATLALGK